MDIEEGEEEHRRDGETAAVRRQGKTDAATSAPDGSHRPREREGGLCRPHHLLLDWESHFVRMRL